MNEPTLRIDLSDFELTQCRIAIEQRIATLGKLITDGAYEGHEETARRNLRETCGVLEALDGARLNVATL